MRDGAVHQIQLSSDLGRFADLSVAWVRLRQLQIATGWMVQSESGPTGDEESGRKEMQALGEKKAKLQISPHHSIVFPDKQGGILGRQSSQEGGKARPVKGMAWGEEAVLGTAVAGGGV